MKFLRALLSLLIIFSFYQFTHAEDQKYDPLLVVVIMVKDETDVIKPTLEMYCKADPKGKKSRIWSMIRVLIHGVVPWRKQKSFLKNTI